jgi:hypothetical protein
LKFLTFSWNLIELIDHTDALRTIAKNLCAALSAPV